MIQIDQAIFITNTFASAHPKEHVELWRQFEKEVPFSKRSGAYGIDNLAYVRWLRAQRHPLVKQFIDENVIMRSF